MKIFKTVDWNEVTTGHQDRIKLFCYSSRFLWKKSWNNYNRCNQEDGKDLYKPKIIFKQYFNEDLKLNSHFRPLVLTLLTLLLILCFMAL